MNFIDGFLLIVKYKAIVAPHSSFEHTFPYGFVSFLSDFYIRSRLPEDEIINFFALPLHFPSFVLV